MTSVNEVGIGQMTDELAIKMIAVLERIAKALEARDAGGAVLDHMLAKDYGIIKYNPSVAENGGKEQGK